MSKCCRPPRADCFFWTNLQFFYLSPPQSTNGKEQHRDERRKRLKDSNADICLILLMMIIFSNVVSPLERFCKACVDLVKCITLLLLLRNTPIVNRRERRVFVHFTFTYHHERNCISNYSYLSNLLSI